MSESQEFNPESQKIQVEVAKFSPEHHVLHDKLEELGVVKTDTAEYFEFLNSFDSTKADIILQYIDQKIWPEPKIIKEKLDKLRSQYSLTLTDEEAAAALQSDPETNNIDYEKAKEEYNLELSIIRGSEAAERLLQEVINNKMDINTEQGQQAFIKNWKKECPNLSMPCVPPNDFWYLQQLAQNRIVSNLEGADRQSAAPRFQEDEILFVDNWTEQDYEDKKAKKSHTSKLLKALLPPELANQHGRKSADSAVNIRRQDLDTALWEGDPAKRIPTKKHKEILNKLKCDPEQFEFRPIRQDEYARLASAQGWGQKDLWTNFDNYFLGVDDRHGLIGRDRDDGGAARVGDYWRVFANPDIAVRLVLSRKQK
ncbi:MAG: hypothetical protein G01um101413_532 [Parcubacteria group bacterium Gr01-1014_13]|nr:MAG: hypothetical protein G01um101413_532 [Parcubacteria group bacterium Gr01-1014_13]